MELFTGGRRLIAGGLAVAALGAVGLAIGFAVDPSQAFASYLTAWSYVWSTLLGMLILLMACHAMNATWPTAVRRLGEAALAALPLVAVAFLPLLFGLGRLYPWMHPERIADAPTRALVEHKRAWLNLPFFYARTLANLVIWTAVAVLLRALSLRLDEPGRPAARGALKIASCALLPLVGITMTLASFDWLMALSPDWYSTMFGVYVFAGGFLAALALLTVLVAAAQRAGFLARVHRPHWYALGRLLLSFVIFWAYIAFFQFFLMWIGNKPIEARWYLERSRGGHRIASGFLLFGHFALPFLYLLPYGVKQRARPLVVISVWLLFAHYVDVHWLVAHPASWQDLCALAFVVGAATAFGTWRQRGHRLAPLHDPAYAEALEYASE
jgi:hypothetical protein